MKSITSQPWHTSHTFDLSPGTVIAVISDVHSNAVALEAVLEHMEQFDVDYIINLGDVVGYGPHPQEAFERVVEVSDINIRGNHDNNAPNPAYKDSNKQAYKGLVHTNNELTDEQLETVSTFPHMADVNGRLVFAHSHPDQPEKRGKYVTPSNVTRLQSTFGEWDADLIGLGHSHYPINQELSQFGKSDEYPRVVLNPGSVGQPRDNDWRASYATITMGKHNSFDVEHHRVEYDFLSVIDDINYAGLPKETGERLKP